MCAVIGDMVAASKGSGGEGAKKRVWAKVDVEASETYSFRGKVCV